MGQAQEEFVRQGGYRFRSRHDGKRLGSLAKFHWEMVPAAGGDLAAVGLEILQLDDDDRIRVDHQFIEA